jgi:hypothetical protein
VVVYPSSHASDEYCAWQYGVSRVCQKLFTRSDGDDDQERQEVGAEQNGWNIERDPVVNQVYQRMIIRRGDGERSRDTVLPLQMKLGKEYSRIVEKEAMDEILENL